MELALITLVAILFILLLIKLASRKLRASDFSQYQPTKDDVTDIRNPYYRDKDSLGW